MEKEIAALKKQRASNKGILTQILNFLNNAKESTPIEEFRTRLMRVDKLMSEFTTIEFNIFQLDAKEESDYQYEESYYKAVTGLNTWIRSITSTSTSCANLDTSVNMTQAAGAHTEVKLPRINIPTFSGEYTEWPSFFDLYCSTIHESQSLNPVQKFQYLKGLLRGEPAILLRHISVTEANYLGALNKLKERYNRKRPIIYSFIRTFIEQPVIHTTNATNIKRLMETSDEVVRGLKALGENAETRDPWLIFLLLSKLDDKSKAQWAETTADVDNPTFSDFLKFLARRIDTLESLTIPTRRANPKSIITSNVTSNNATTNNYIFKCALCQGEHSLFQCQNFNKMDVTSRREWTKINQRCFNCLSSKHPVIKCTSQRRCMQCKRKHQSLLHDNEKTEDSADTPKTNTAKDVQLSACSQSKSSQTILPTAIINILDSSGHIQNCRALLDSGSQVSFITEACSQRLNLKKRNARLSVCGVGKSKVGFTKGIVTFAVRTENDGEINIEALVLPSITTKVPPQSYDHLITNIYQGIKLADPNFHVSSNVDILIGADYFFELLEVGQIKLNKIGPVFQKTVFGWVASGKIGSVIENDAISMMTTSDNPSIIDIDQTLRRFWEIESITSNINILSPEEQLCEDKFIETLQQTADGRFVVGLPFRRSPECLGDSVSTAIQRLCSMERRFARDPEFKTQYQKFMLEYLELNHMQEIPQEVNNSGFYLPHHGVLRHSSTTTKLRVVFDGSAKSSSGVSLNDCLAVGRTTQSTLYAIILRFREHTIVFSADVEKMYRQVQITEADTNYQKLVWRTTPSESIRHYRLLTVTYGLAAAPFLATRAVKQIAVENQKTSPVAANVIQRDIYVDDLMTGADSEDKAMKLLNY